eukprot:TRINITY_DN4483_c1_g1_i14.p1 TRINITY_DN4483_c1_g1~~TRINITY_DN4483_c1_g1_i14.p1  ORF type:complete len:469 (-),score=98.04 TRINITY_DN4483_c1_g1_i14:1196-2518(-)
MQQKLHLTEEHKHSCSAQQKGQKAKGQTRPLNEHSELNNVAITDESNADGETDRLLVLAQLAELLMESESNFSSDRNRQHHEETRKLYHSQNLNEMRGDQIHDEMDQRCDTAQKQEEHVYIMAEQREQQNGHQFVTAPAQQLEVTNVRGQQLYLQPHVIEQQLMQRTNDRMEKQHDDLTQPQERFESLVQIHATGEGQREQLSASDPQRLKEMSDDDKDHQDISHQPSAMVKHGHPMPGEERSRVYVAEQELVPPTPLVLGGQLVGVDHQWLLQKHSIQVEQYQIPAGQQTADLVEVQRASENVDKNLPRCDLSKESNSDGQDPHRHAATMDEKSDELLLQLEHNFHQPSKDNDRIDQYVEHQIPEKQVTADTEAVRNVLRVKGRIRLTQVKREARLKYASIVEEKQEEQVAQQNRKGQTRLNQVRRQARKARGTKGLQK